MSIRKHGYVVVLSCVRVWIPYYYNFTVLFRRLFVSTNYTLSAPICAINSTAPIYYVVLYANLFLEIYIAQALNEVAPSKVHRHRGRRLPKRLSALPEQTLSLARDHNHLLLHIHVVRPPLTLNRLTSRDHVLDLSIYPSKHILNAQVSIRAPCCKLWYDCAECHAEAQTHRLAKTNEMAFICKKCKKAFRKDMVNYEESDEYCPHCDNHYVRVHISFSAIGTC